MAEQESPDALINMLFIGLLILATPVVLVGWLIIQAVERIMGDTMK